MASLPPPEHIPATPRDAMLQTKPIPAEWAAIMVPRMMRRIRYNNRTGCWLRTTSLNPAGYSTVSLTVDGKHLFFLAHRVSYTHHVGPIPPGYTLDHLCGRPACVQPKHLEAVTHRQNVLRSRKNPYAISARNKRQRDAGRDA